MNTPPKPADISGVSGAEGTPVADADVALMRRLQAGDERAFRDLFAKYQRKIVNFARRYLGSMERAEDAAQEVFLRLYRARQHYRPEAKFSTYLYRIATNTCLNHLRRQDWQRKDHAAHDATDPTDNIADAAAVAPDEALFAKQLQAKIGRALTDLPENQRAALILLRFDDLSYEEIASVLETSVPAVKSLLNRAKEQLLKKLGNEVAGFSVPYQKGKNDGL